MKTSIIITGGFGFIGSNLVAALNARGITPYVIEHGERIGEKWKNVRDLRFHLLTMDELWLPGPNPTIVHLGANVDTREAMSMTLWENNVKETQRLRRIAGRFIYASSGSVYGAEEHDFTERLDGLKPMNAYAFTKLQLDRIFFGGAEPMRDTYALRFFNVYGERETYKGDMASLVTKGLLKQAPLYQAKTKPDIVEGLNGGYQEVNSVGARWSLFKLPSAAPILRDFVHVSDVAATVIHFIENDCPAGIYNVGTGKARSFEDLVKTVEDLPVEYIPLPDSLKAQYQAHTQADITRLREVAKYAAPFLTLEEGVERTRAWMKAEKLI